MSQMALAGSYLFASVALFYLGGWSIVWGESIDRFNLLINGELGLGADFLFGGRYVAILFNSEYYGLVIVNRYFDSIFLSYCAFGAGLVLAYNAFGLALAGEKQDKE